MLKNDARNDLSSLNVFNEHCSIFFKFNKV